MKRLTRTLVAYSRVLFLLSFLALPVLTASSQAYALTTPAHTFAVYKPITCAGGPTLSNLSTSTPNGKGEACFIKEYVDPFVIVLSGLVAVFVVLSIIIAGIQYSAAADDSSKVSAAKDRIRNALIALLAYIFLLAFVEYLLPGGIAA